MKTPSFLATPLLFARRPVAPDRLGLFLFFLASLADGALMPFFALWAQHEADIPVRYIGLLLACYAGGELVATPLLGGIADRIGRRPVLLCSTLGVGLGFVLLSHMHGVLAIALCLLAIGIFECALHPTVQTVIGDVVPEDQLRMRFASARIASGVGHVVGPALGAALALLSLNTVFVGCGVTLLLAALLVFCLMPETRPDHARAALDDEEDEEGLSALFPAFRDRRLATLLLWFLLLEIVDGWSAAVIPLYANGEHALSPSGVGLLFTYAAAVMAVLQWPVSKWSERMSSYPLVIGSGVALAGAFALLLLPPVALTLYASVTLFSLAQVLFGPLVPVTVNALAPPKARASYMAAVSTVNDLKDSAGPATGMFLYGLSASLPWMLGVPVALGAALGLATTIRRHERVAS